MKPILFAFPLLALATPAFAGPSNEVLATTPDGKTEKLVCKRIALTGSRIGASRVCRTQAEWDADAASAAQTTRRMQQSRETTHGM